MTNDLISREAALDLFRNAMNSYRIVGMRSGKALIQRTVNEAFEGLNKLPAVDAEPVVHGRWIKHCACVECSVCGYNCWADSAPTYDYCPYCGAKMDAGDNANA